MEQNTGQAQNIGKGFYGWRIVAVCFIIMFLAHTMGASLTGIFTIPVSEALGIGRGQFTLWGAISSLVATIFAPIAGFLFGKDRFKRLMIFGSVGYGVSFLFFSIAPNIKVIYAAAILTGVSITCLTLLPISILVANWFTAKRGAVMGFIMTGSSFGAFALSPLTQALIDRFGWRITYQILAAMIICILTPLIALVIRRAPADMGQEAYTEKKPGTGAVAAKGAVGFTFKEIMLSPSYMLFLLATFLLIFLTACGIMATVPILVERGYTPKEAAGLFGISMIFLVCGKFLLGYLFDKFGLRKIIVLSILCLIGSSACLLYADTKAFFWMYAILYGLGGSVGTVAPSYMSAVMYGRKEYNKLFGPITAVTRFGAVFGTPIAGFIFDSYKTYNPALWLMIIALSACIATYLLSIQLCPKMPEEAAA